MAFHLTSATAYAQGSWNIYILQPEWLCEKGVLVTKRPVKVETLRGGPGVRLTTTGKGSPRWVATPFSVRVEYDNPATAGDVGEPLRNLIRVLPETPMSLVGFELIYRGSAPEDAGAVPPPAAATEPLAEYGASISVEKEGVLYYLHLSCSVSEGTARLIAICDQPPGGEILQSYAKCEEVVRATAETHWRVTFS